MARRKCGTGLLLAAVTAVALAAAQPSALAAEPAPLVVILNKAEVLHLKHPARRVIVGNPGIADVVLETPTMLYLFGKTPGETSLHVLGDDDRALLARPVVVTTPNERAVAVHVPGGDGPTTRAYSCISTRCLKVTNPEAGGSGGSPGAVLGAMLDAGLKGQTGGTIPVQPPDAGGAAPPPAR